MEFCVALMLILLGVITLAGVSRWIRSNFLPAPDGSFPRHTHAPGTPAHVHTHVHGDYVHSHVHGHGKNNHGHDEADTPQAKLDRWFGRLSIYQSLRPLAIGIVHGLAGSAFIALLILTQIRSPLWGLLYLLLFGIGTIAGMMLITSAIALPFAYTLKRLPHLNVWLRFSAGIISLVFGLYLAYRIGIIDGLFTDHPQWNPA
jgi:ABC-type nickel/cobalt efflux system permease component RcnA